MYDKLLVFVCGAKDALQFVLGAMEKYLKGPIIPYWVPQTWTVQLGSELSGGSSRNKLGSP